MLLESSVSEKYSSKRFFIPHITNSFINISLFKDTCASTTINIFLGIKVNKGEAVPVRATKL